MKRILLAAVAALALFSCHAPPPNHAPISSVYAAMQPAENIRIGKGYITAGYDNGAAAVYLDSTATVITTGLPQTELSGVTSIVEGGAWMTTDTANGNWVKIYPFTGVTMGRINGQSLYFLPENGTEIAN
jgi:hypothetical protein